MECQKQGHVVYHTRYHVVIITKYRRRVLKGGVAEYLKVKLQEVSHYYPDIEILEANTDEDHVHLLVSAPPHMSASKIMQYIKGKTSRKLMMEFRHIQKAFWGRHLWARGYFVATSGNVTDEVIQEYIRLQQEGEPPDGGGNFRVEGE